MGTMNAALAAELEGARSAARMTQKQLAAASGIPQVTIQRLLAGTRVINVDVLATLAEALEIAPEKLFRRAALRTQHLLPALDETDEQRAARLGSERRRSTVVNDTSKGRNPARGA